VLQPRFSFRLRQATENALARRFRICSWCDVIPMKIVMKAAGALLFAALLALSSAPAHAVVLDLSTMTCKQFIGGSQDEIKMVLTWMDGWYKGDSDEAIIDTDALFSA
jgi:hypothetical protein